jgi:hypothetical protein
MHGESASADKEEAEKFCRKFKKFNKREEYRPEQIFNCDETGLLLEAHAEPYLHHER